ncbi:MAG: alpha/beta hydrolase [Caldilineaceae bacterium]
MTHTEPIYKSEAGRRPSPVYDRLLAQWPAPLEQVFVRTRHGETFVARWGNLDGPPLVLLHGSGSNSATWMGDAAAYAEQCQAYAVDIPGEPGKRPTAFLGTGRPSTSGWTMSWISSGLGTVALGGMSLGGWATINYAAARPDRVSHAVLIVPSRHLPTVPGFVLRMLGYALLGRPDHDDGVPLRRPGDDAGLREFLTLTGAHFNFRYAAPSSAARNQRLTMPVFSWPPPTGCWIPPRPPPAWRSSCPGSRSALTRGRATPRSTPRPRVMDFSPAHRRSRRLTLRPRAVILLRLVRTPSCERARMASLEHSRAHEGVRTERGARSAKPVAPPPPLRYTDVDSGGVVDRASAA